MKTMKYCTALLLAVALSALFVMSYAGMTFAQSRMADIEDAKRLLEENPTVNNRLRLGTLQYLEGVDYLQAGDMQNAIDWLQAGVWTLEDSQGTISDTSTEMEEARYGLSYALVLNKQPVDGVLVMEKLVSSSPNYGKARYLLGVTLMNIPGKENSERGLEVMVQLASDGNPPYMEMAEQAATRIGYNYSVVDHAQGNVQGALSTLSSTLDSVGRNKGADQAENELVGFAMGVYQADSGDLFGALSEFEAVYEVNDTFQLESGAALSGLLSNTQYQAGLEQLSLGGETAALGAVDLFDSALRTGDSQATDALHGKAVAYTVAGDTAAAVETLKELVKIDASYYAKIKK